MWLFVFKRPSCSLRDGMVYAAVYADGWRNAEKILFSFPGARGTPAWTGRRVSGRVTNVEPGMIMYTRQGQQTCVVRHNLEPRFLWDGSGDAQAVRRA